MKISANYDEGYFNLIPTTDREIELFGEIEKIAKPGMELLYGGASSDNEGFRIPKFNFGGGMVPVVEKHGNVTIHKEKLVEGVTISLVGDSEEDKSVANSIRNNTFFGKGFPTLIEVVRVEGVINIRFTSTYCEKCGHPMITFSGIQWAICDACSEKCEHTYEIGPTISGRGDIGYGEFCSICGRGNPNKQRMSKEMKREFLAMDNIHVIGPLKDDE